ncbi:cytochrome c biogenesis CcdA family protein [Actinocorallia populi]|uniref:cytochrome c biogenesis CcdA family protein n=1 Tax=Actinocorallia populi TaxID=2079200 RepID=UPI000D08B061|nr:cytochrome c biogenesis CcdA family protein [Actinocorallia populi]
MDDLALALAAGLVAAFNPCGFALLPSYLALLLAGPGGLWRALRLSAAMTAGFVTVFGTFGLLISLVAAPLQRYLPWATIVIGVALVLLGVWLLAGKELLVRVPHLKTGGPASSFAALYGYGASYAVASLSCTVGPFLAVTGLASGTGDILDGLSAFLAYALGMGLIVAVLSLLVAFAQEAAVRRLRRVLPYVSRTSGALLLAAGLYVTYYGWYELRVLDGAAADDPVIRAFTEVQGAITGHLTDLGTLPVAVVFAVLLLLALVFHRARR